MAARPGRCGCSSSFALPALTARAQEAAPAPCAPPEVQLVEILRKPEVQAWLEQGAPATAALARGVEEMPGATSPASSGSGWPN